MEPTAVKKPLTFRFLIVSNHARTGRARWLTAPLGFGGTFPRYARVSRPHIILDRRSPIHPKPLYLQLPKHRHHPPIRLPSSWPVWISSGCYLSTNVES